MVDERFHRLIDADARRRGDLLVLHPVITRRHLVENLFDDAHRLADLVEADRVAVVAVAVRADDDIEIDLVVGEVGLIAAKVPGVAGRSKDRTGGRQGECLIGVQRADALQAFTPDRLPGHEDVVLLEARRQQFKQRLDLTLPAIGKIGGDTTGADVVVVHPQARDLFEEAEDFFALTPAVDHHRHGTEIHAVRGHEQQVRADAVELAHQHADPHRTLRDLDVEELLGGEAERQFGEERRGVVHAGDVGAPLQEGQLLCLLLHTGVQVAHDRLGTNDGLALHL